jgi:hypothetical protein
LYYCEKTVHLKFGSKRPKNAVFFPFYSTPGMFGLVKNNRVQSMAHKFRRGMRVGSKRMDKFEHSLQKHAKEIHCFVVADSRLYPDGTRIKCGLPSELEKLDENWEVAESSLGIKVFSGYQSVHNEEHPGHLLSWWFKSKEVHPYRINQATIELFQKAYGRKGSFDDRSSSRCATLGHNTYAGRRASTSQRVRPTPSEGPGDFARMNYFRANYDARYTPKNSKLVQYLAGQASYTAQWLDLIVTGLCQYDGTDQDPIHLFQQTIITFGKLCMGLPIQFIAMEEIWLIVKTKTMLVDYCMILNPNSRIHVITLQHLCQLMDLECQPPARISLYMTRSRPVLKTLKYCSTLC